MSGIDFNSGSNKGDDDKKRHIGYIDEESELYRVWMVESNNSFRKESTPETSDYREAFEIFDKKSKNGKSVILYEIQKSKHDNSVLKKIPFLNSAVIEERKKQKEIQQGTLYGNSNDADAPNKIQLSIWKYGILALVGITAALLLTMFVFDIMSGRPSITEIGNLTRHFIIYEFAKSSIEFPLSTGLPLDMM